MAPVPMRVDGGVRETVAVATTTETVEVLRVVVVDVLLWLGATEIVMREEGY